MTELLLNLFLLCLIVLSVKLFFLMMFVPKDYDENRWDNPKNIAKISEQCMINQWLASRRKAKSK